MRSQSLVTLVGRVESKEMMVNDPHDTLSGSHPGVCCEKLDLVVHQRDLTLN